MKPTFAPILAVSLLWASSVRSAPTKSGPVFKPTSCAACLQDEPAAAGNPVGSLLVTWEGLAPTASRGVPARFFRPDGSAKGADFQAVAAAPNTTASEPRLAGNAKGFVLVWAVEAGGDSDVFARRYSTTGVAVGAAVQVNVDDPKLPLAPSDSLPDVSLAADGSFVVAWLRFVPFYDDASPGVPPAIFVRRFSSAGSPLAAPAQISTGLVGSERPALCVATTGATTVAWTSIDRREPFVPSLEGVSLRRLLATGVPQKQTLVLAAPNSTRSRVAAACGKDGGALVAWSGELPPAASDGDVAAQRFGNDGKKAGAAFVVNSERAGEQGAPAVSYDPTGAFVVAWSSRDGFDDFIRVRRFSAAGVPTSADVEVVNDAGAGTALGPPALGHTKGGDFAVLWRNGSRHLFAQRMKP